MKKLLKGLCVIVLIISIFIISAIVVANLLHIIRILFFGITVGTNEAPNSIWWEETFLYGISGVKRFYSVWGAVVLIFEIPISIVCIIYQIIYFKILKKKCM
jgi:hypothetical protein